MSDTPDKDEPSTARRRRRRWFRRAPINLGELAVETIAVVFGILLALGIDDWHRGRTEAAQVDEAMHAMRVELDDNYRKAEHHVQRMEAMAARMAAAKDNRSGPARPCFEWDEWNGIDLQTFVDAAYQTSMATQALAHLPFDQAHRLSSLYAGQQHLERVQSVESDFLLANVPRPLEACTGIAMEVAYADRTWIKEYRRQVAALGLPHHAALAPPAKNKPPRPAAKSDAGLPGP